MTDFELTRCASNGQTGFKWKYEDYNDKLIQIQSPTIYSSQTALNENNIIVMWK